MEVQNHSKAQKNKQLPDLGSLNGFSDFGAGLLTSGLLIFRMGLFSGS
jgi:hypothetical protein